MSNLDPRIEAVRAKYDLARDDFWQIKQNRQWVCKHAALEVVAVRAKIEWLPPQIIEANAPELVTSMIVTGRMGDRVEWATGETNKTNYSVVGKQPAYPWAMSEKRAKDRVVLKLVGIHGLVYSEDEMPSVSDEPRTTDQRSEQGRREVENQSRQQSPPKQKETPKDERQPSEREVSLWKEMNALTSLRGLKLFWQDYSSDLKYMGEEVFKRFETKKDELKGKLPMDTPKTAKQEDDRFPGDEPIRDVSGREMHNVEA